MDPLTIEKIQDLRDQGFGYKAIASKLGMNPFTVRGYVEHYDLSTGKGLKHADHFNENYEQLAEIVAQGFGKSKIMEVFGLGEGVAEKWLRRARIMSMPESKRREAIEGLVADGATPIQIARATHLPISQAMGQIRKVTEAPESSESSVRLELAKGTTLGKLNTRFGVQSLEEVHTLVSDVFDGEYLTIDKKMANGDTSIIVVPDKTGEFKWLDQQQDKPFSYFTNAANNYMYVDLPDSLPDEIKIYNLTDTHIGSKYCRTELLKQHIQMIADDPAALVFLGGDMFEFIHKHSVGQPWEQKIAPMEQLAVSARMLKPIAHKVIRYVGGNHDRGRGYKLVGADLAEVLGKLLRVSYGHMETTIDFNFKGHNFTGILHHGGGHGGSVQGILNDAESYRRHVSYFVHWHLSGHVHNAQIIEREATKKVEGVGLIHDRYFTVIGGSYMSHTSTYAEETKYIPTPQDLTYIVMRADGSHDAGRVRIGCI